MNRLPPLSTAHMSEQQCAMYEEMIASRGAGIINPDGSLQGPFDVMLRSPALGDAIQKTGAQVRFESSLTGAQRELAILICAQYWRANFEWWVHHKVALAEGIDEATINVIYHGKKPDNADFAIIDTFLRILNKTGRVDAELYAAALELLGEQAIVELTMLSGYYALISQLLNVFEVPLPEGETLPFPEPIV